MSAAKKEWLAKKAEVDRLKLEELTKDMSKGQVTETVEQMRAMNLDDQVVQKVQQKLESDAREKVLEIQGGSGYETYD